MEVPNTHIQALCSIFKSTNHGCIYEEKRLKKNKLRHLLPSFDNQYILRMRK